MAKYVRKTNMSPEHLKNMRKPRGDKSPRWKGDNVIAKNASQRARTILTDIPKGYERHHIDGDPYNNDPTNILMVTHKQHMIVDGRIERLKKELKESPLRLRRSGKKEVQQN